MVKAYREMALYASAELMFKALPIAILPFLLAVISPSEFGVIELYLTLLAGVLGMLGLGAGSAIHRYYYDANFDAPNHSSIVASSIFCVFISALLFSAIFFSGFENFSAYLGVPVELETKLCLYVYALFSLFSQVLLDLVRVGRGVSSYLLGAGVSKVVGPLLALLFVVYYSAGPAGYFLALALAAVAGFLTVLYLTLPLLVGAVVQKKYIVLVLNYGWPLALMAPLQWSISGFDRFFLAKDAGLEVMGGYALAAKFSFVGTALFSAFLAAWGPAAFRFMNKGPAALRSAHELVYTFLTFLFFVGLLLVLVFGRLIFDLLFPADFSSSVSYLLLLVYGAVVPLISASLYTYVSMSGRTYVFLVITFLGGIISVLLNFVLITLYGAMGAASAVALVGGVLFFGNLYFCYRCDAPVPPMYFCALKVICLLFVFLSVVFSGAFDYLLLAFCVIAGALAFRRLYHLVRYNKQLLSAVS